MHETAKQAVASAYNTLGTLGERERSEQYRLNLTVGFVESVGGYTGKRVLDLGSSLGLHLLAAKQLGATKLVGVDKYIFPETFENDFILSRSEMDELK
ncbi:MAG: hypothetical protein NUW08_03670, partial [Candidatus Uhrbacteria bacterium]|nr:hypothetical protein [Candidatus Uhrbacteria bacterium]